MMDFVKKTTGLRRFVKSPQTNSIVLEKNGKKIDAFLVCIEQWFFTFFASLHLWYKNENIWSFSILN
jgi:hypothetical protein